MNVSFDDVLIQGVVFQYVPSCTSAQITDRAHAETTSGQPPRYTSITSQNARGIQLAFTLAAENILTENVDKLGRTINMEH